MHAYRNALVTMGWCLPIVVPQQNIKEFVSRIIAQKGMPITSLPENGQIMSMESVGQMVPI